MGLIIRGPPSQGHHHFPSEKMDSPKVCGRSHDFFVAYFLFPTKIFYAPFWILGATPLFMGKKRQKLLRTSDSTGPYLAVWTTTVPVGMSGDRVVTVWCIFWHIENASFGAAVVNMWAKMLSQPSHNSFLFRHLALCPIFDPKNCPTVFDRLFVENAFLVG